jgi:hypothetical protein
VPVAQRDLLISSAFAAVAFEEDGLHFISAGRHELRVVRHTQELFTLGLDLSWRLSRDRTRELVASGWQRRVQRRQGE